MATNVAVYTRISRDDSGAQTSTRRQERLCREWVAEQGWDVAEVFEDVDQSAWDPRVLRGRYEALIRAVTAHHVDVVVVWRLDRLVRSPGEFERFWAACRNSGVQIRSVTEPVSGDDPVSLAIVRILVTFAGLESDVRGIRLRAKHRETATSGKPPTGGTRCFGYTAGYTAIIEEEANEVREAARRILDSGESVSDISRSWRERKVPTVRDGKWQASQIRKMLMHPRYAGDRAYQGEVVATDCWPAILDRLTAAELRSKLAGGVGQGHRDPAAPGLVRGLLRCGRCGGTMVIGKARDRPQRRYICQSRPQGCNGVFVSQPEVDAWVLERVLWRIEARRSPNHRTRWDRDDTDAIIRALDGRTEALHELNRRYFVTADLTYPEWVRARDDLTMATGQQLAREAPYRRPRGLPPNVPIWKVRSVWDELTTVAKAEIIITELAWITVQPSPTVNLWCPERLEPHWILPDPPGAPGPGPRRASSTARWTSRDGQRWPSENIPAAAALRQQPGPFDAAEACQLTGLSEQALRAHRHGGRVSVLRDGWRYRYTAAALADLKRGRNLTPRRLTRSQAASLAQVAEHELDGLIDLGRLELRQCRRDGTTWLSAVEVRRFAAHRA